MVSPPTIPVGLSLNNPGASDSAEWHHQCDPLPRYPRRSVGGGERGLLGLAFHPGFSNPLSPGFQRLYTYSTQTPAGPSDFIVPMLGSPDNHVLTEWQVLPRLECSRSRRAGMCCGSRTRNPTTTAGRSRPSDVYLCIAVGGRVRTTSAMATRPFSATRRIDQSARQNSPD
jgi:hypothetical protein